jgi:hypothetical protein
MKQSKYMMHKRFAATMPNPCFGDVLATDDAETICADLTFAESGPLAGVALLNRVIRYLDARRDAITPLARANAGMTNL